MPANQRSVVITDAYRRQLLTVRERTAGMLADRWRMIDWGDLDGSFRRWLPQAAAVLQSGQAVAAGLAAPYLSAFMSSELDETTTTPAVDAPSIAGTTRDGRPIIASLAGAMVATKMAILHRRPQPEALRAGLQQVVRSGRYEVADAGRRALGEAMATEERVVGWRRVAHLRACGACLADASGRVHPPESALRIHSACSCSQEPVVRDVAERVRRPTGRETFDAMSIEEQDRLFAGRGGAAKAELVRSGAVSFEALITTETSHASGLFITETPLRQLVSATA